MRAAAPGMSVALATMTVAPAVTIVVVVVGGSVVLVVVEVVEVVVGGSVVLVVVAAVVDVVVVVGGRTADVVVVTRGARVIATVELAESESLHPLATRPESRIVATHRAARLDGIRSA